MEIILFSSIRLLFILGIYKNKKGRNSVTRNFPVSKTILWISKLQKTESGMKNAEKSIFLLTIYKIKVKNYFCAICWKSIHFSSQDFLCS